MRCHDLAQRMTLAEDKQLLILVTLHSAIYRMQEILGTERANHLLGPQGRNVKTTHERKILVLTLCDFEVALSHGPSDFHQVTLDILIRLPYVMRSIRQPITRPSVRFFNYVLLVHDLQDGIPIGGHLILYRKQGRSISPVASTHGLRFSDQRLTRELSTRLEESRV